MVGWTFFGFCIDLPFSLADTIIPPSRNDSHKHNHGNDVYVLRQDANGNYLPGSSASSSTFGKKDSYNVAAGQSTLFTDYPPDGRRSKGNQILQAQLLAKLITLFFRRICNET